MPAFVANFPKLCRSLLAITLARVECGIERWALALILRGTALHRGARRALGAWRCRAQGRHLAYSEIAGAPRKLLMRAKHTGNDGLRHTIWRDIPVIQQVCQRCGAVRWVELAPTVLAEPWSVLGPDDVGLPHLHQRLP